MSCGDHISEEGAGGSTSTIEPQSGSSQASGLASGSSSSLAMGEDIPGSKSPGSPGSPGEKRTVARCLHQRYRRNTTSVACQTDYTDEFPSPVNSCTKEISADTSASSSSEGVLRLMIQNFRSMTDTVRGPSKRIQGVCWRIMVMPRQHVVQKKGTQKCLGFFLQCCPNAYSDTWSCQAAAELRLISQKQGVPHFTRKTNHNYTAKENDWGYSCFMTWADILDEAQGYIKDDRVILEVTVKAEIPKSILSHEDFQKSIQNWIDLAEMQYTRGCIDLAIEANAQALKFCKEKDPAVKTRLEEQKSFFIEQKLVESIQRIEKGKDGSSKVDEEVVSQSVLKQALTSNSTKNCHGKNKDRTKKGKKQQRDPSPVSPPNSPPTLENRDNSISEDNSRKGSKTINSPLTMDFTGTLNGHFNKELLTSYPVYTSWIQRNRNEDDVYDSLAKQLEDSLERLHLSGPHYDEEYAMRCINERFTKCQNGLIPQKKGRIAEQQIRHLAENAFDVELQRQMIIKKATEDALRFQQDVDSLNTDGKEDTSEADIVEFNIADLWTDEKQEKRLSIIDREARFLDAKIRLFWNDDEANCWMDDENCESEKDSVCSSDSDRQYDGSIKAKRSKRDHELTCTVDGCSCVEKPQSPIDHVDMCEMGVQTESLISTNAKVTELRESVEEEKKMTVAPPAPLPTGRVLKKATSKKGKGSPQKMGSPSKEEQSAPEGVAKGITLPLRDVTEAPNGILSDLTKSVIPRVLPMEYAMKFFPDAVNDGAGPKEDGNTENTTKVLEDWVRMCLIDCAKGQGKNGETAATTNSLPINIEVTGNLSEHITPHITTALSAVAMNFMNTRRVISKIDELSSLIADNCSSRRMRKTVVNLSSLAGMTHISEPEEPKLVTFPSGQNGMDNLNADDFANLSNKILNRDMEGDYVLVSQLSHLDDVQSALEKYDFISKEDTRRMQQAVCLIEGRLQSGIKQNKDLERKADETEKQLKRLEKQIKTETANMKNQLQAEKDKNISLTKEMKEKNKEIKKLENKVFTISSERDDAHDRAKQLQRESQNSQKKSNEEHNKLKKEISNLNESKKHIQAELANRDAEVRSLTSQLEERNQLVKKLKQECEQEKQRCSSSNQAMAAALERAKKAEISMLNQELEAGVALLERARLDATKQTRDMDDAASNRARNQNEINNYISNRNEWKGIIEKIDGFITKAKADYARCIDSIQGGKALSSMPKICVPKPPPPPPIVKIPPIVSVEPTKPVPGVIGSRPQGHIANISPASRAPGSPVQKAGVSPASPVRHPGAIGTRPSGLPVNGASSDRMQETPCTSSSISSSHTTTAPSVLNNWPWSDPLSMPEPTTISPTAELAMPTSSTTSVPRVDQNGWDEHNNTWSSPIGTNAGFLSSMGNRSAFSHPPGWSSQSNSQHIHHQHQQQLTERHRAYMQSPWPIIADRIMKKLHCDHEAALLLATSYVSEHNLNVLRVHPEEVAEAICQKRFSDVNRLPPGAAPGYLHNPLMGSFVDRNPIGPPLGSMLNNQDHVLGSSLNGLLAASLNGELNGAIRTSASSTDKWNGV